MKDDDKPFTLVIADTVFPYCYRFRVGEGKITYFWGVAKLPVDSHEASHCTEYLLANDDRLVSYCDVKDMERFDLLSIAQF